MVRNRDAVVRKNRHPNGAALHGYVVDLESVVVVDRRRDLFQVRDQFAGIDFADEYFREPRLGCRAAGPTPVLWVMDGESGLIEIPLELEISLLDKLLVVGVTRDGRKLVSGVEGANPLEIDVEEAVRAGQKPDCLRWSALPELDDRDNCRSNCEHADQNREGALDPHEGLQGRNDSTLDVLSSGFSVHTDVFGQQHAPGCTPLTPVIT